MRLKFKDPSLSQEQSHQLNATLTWLLILVLSGTFMCVMHVAVVLCAAAGTSFGATSARMLRARWPVTTPPN